MQASSPSSVSSSLSSNPSSPAHAGSTITAAGRASAPPSFSSFAASLASAASAPPAGSASGSLGVPDEPVSPEVLAVIDLYATQLAEVAFPDIDAGTLRRHADGLRAESQAVARAREALDLAIASCAARRAELAEVASRAVAYARIYSEAHPESHALASAIAALAAPARTPAAGGVGATPPTGKRRGRPPKRSAELFDAPAAPDAP